MINNKADRIQNAINHIKTATDVDPWAIEIAVEAMEKELKNSTDTISRADAIDARRYAFGNDEFSLEAAYHDCKLVFDGITDDDSFQEADTGLVLYYANEIIYALQEALEGKDTNVHSSCSESPNNSTLQLTCNNLATDLISRADAIDEINRGYEDWEDGLVTIKEMRERIMALPSAQPEIIHCKDCKWWRQQTNYQGAPLPFGFCESDDMWRSLYGETNEVSHIDTDDDFYCGYAERRTDE